MIDASEDLVPQDSQKCFEISPLIFDLGSTMGLQFLQNSCPQGIKRRRWPILLEERFQNAHSDSAS